MFRTRCGAAVVVRFGQLGNGMICCGKADADLGEESNAEKQTAVD